MAGPAKKIRLHGRGPDHGLHGRGPDHGLHGRGPDHGLHGRGPDHGLHGRGPDLIGGAAGFTLLEVLVAVAILAIMLTSLLGSQLNSMQATRYARDISIAALLAEWQIVELETQVRKEGFVNSDVELDGDFADQGWDEFNWACTVHFVELPEYNQLVEAKDGADEQSGKDDSNMVDAGDQMFGALGLVWPMVKAAIENSIRKVTCTVTWTTGTIAYEYDVQTFWTNPQALQDLPGAGGEFTDADDPSEGGEEGEGGSGSGGAPPGTTIPSRGGGTGAGGQMGGMGGQP